MRTTRTCVTCSLNLMWRYRTQLQLIDRYPVARMWPLKISYIPHHDVVRTVHTIHVGTVHVHTIHVGAQLVNLIKSKGTVRCGALLPHSTNQSVSQQIEGFAGTVVSRVHVDHQRTHSVVHHILHSQSSVVT